jgi:CRP/FNR family cyclic AMP-dependent transcriptional regulator
MVRCERLLADLGDDRLGSTFLAEIRQQEKRPCQAMIGTTRSRVSFFMNNFRRLGFISYNGTLEVHSSLLSVVLADQPHIKADDA